MVCIGNYCDWQCVPVPICRDGSVPGDEPPIFI
jgi:hypothetical protein